MQPPMNDADITTIVTMVKNISLSFDCILFGLYINGNVLVYLEKSQLQKDIKGFVLEQTTKGNKIISITDINKFITHYIGKIQYNLINILNSVPLNEVQRDIINKTSQELVEISIETMAIRMSHYLLYLKLQEII